MSKRDLEKSDSNRVRVSVYLRKEVADQMQEILDQLPFRATVSGFIESAVEEAVKRYREQGIHIPPMK